MSTSDTRPRSSTAVRPQDRSCSPVGRRARSRPEGGDRHEVPVLPASRTPAWSTPARWTRARSSAGAGPARTAASGSPRSRRPPSPSSSAAASPSRSAGRRSSTVCGGRARAGPSTRTRWPSSPSGSKRPSAPPASAEVPSDEVGLAILGPLRDLDEVAYLRFASVYQAFSSIDDFEKAITELRGDHRDPAPPHALSSSPTPLEPHPAPPPADEGRTAHMTEAPEKAARQGRRAPSHRPPPSPSPTRATACVVERVYTTAGRAPLRRGDLGAARRRHDQLARRLDQLRAARRRVPGLLVGQRRQHRHHQVLPRRGRHRGPRVVAPAAHRPRRAQVRRPPGASTATSARPTTPRSSSTS